MSVFHAYDIRGVYPTELNEVFTQKVGLVLPDVIRTKKVVVGRDVRKSSPALHRAIVKGLLKRGIDVYTIGVCSSPKLYFATYFYDFRAGVMITASHNPAKYNGIKIVKKKAVPLTKEKGLKELEKRIELYQWKEAKKPGRLHEMNVDEDYNLFLEKYVHAPHQLRVVVDVMHGTMGRELHTLKKVAQVTVLHTKEGEFTQAPNPLRKGALQELQREVVRQKAHLGIAFDNDGDRVVFVDEKGKIVLADYLFGLLATFCAKKRDSLVFDLRMSKVLEEVAKKKEMKPVRSRVGHTYITKTMKWRRAPVGAELSGHYYFKETKYTDSGLFAALMIVNLVSQTKQPLSALVQPFQKYVLSNEMNFEVPDKKAAIEKVASLFPGKRTSLDGITITGENFWYNVRASNTEPLVRVRAEANDAATLQMVVTKVKQALR